MLNKTVNWQCHTNGEGYWTRFEQTVTVVRVNIAYVSDEGDFGELRAYFDTKTWNVDEAGLMNSVDSCVAWALLVSPAKISRTVSKVCKAATM